jgi:predicted AAA+ superfamily ATPase
MISLMTETRVRRAVVLLGPRRVGKTVMLYQAIQDRLDRGADPASIFYVSVDSPVYTGLTLEKLLTLFRDLHGHKPNAKLLVVFDEIQYHKDWERHLKSLVDAYPGIQFVASGSAAAALRMKSRESGAGRFTDFLLPPLTFREFLTFTGRPSEIGNEEAGQNVEKLNSALVEYINFGGFPEIVTTDAVKLRMDRYVADDIIDKVLLRDLPSLYGVGDTQELKRLFNVLAYNTGHEVNLEGLSQASGVAKNTLRKYLEYLEAAFLIHRLYRIDQNARHFKRATYFKVYLTNPCIRAALFGPVSNDDPAMGHLAETAFLSQLAHSEAIEDYFYARWPKGEVGFVYLDPGKQKVLLPREIKWSGRSGDVPAEDLAGLIAFCARNGLKKAALHTRAQKGSVCLSGVTIVCVPLAAVCLAIGEVLVEGALKQGVHPRAHLKLLDETVA